MKIKRIILTVIIVFTLGGMATGYYFYNKKVPTLHNVHADYELTANELYDAFDADENAAMSKYGDKVINVKGVVASMKTTDSTSNITIHADNAILGGINCSFNTVLEEMKEGDSVSIKGRCQGILMDVILNNCVKK